MLIIIAAAASLVILIIIIIVVVVSKKKKQKEDPSNKYKVEEAEITKTSAPSEGTALGKKTIDNKKDMEVGPIDPETTHPYRPESDDVTSGATGQVSVVGAVDESALKLRQEGN